MRERVLKWNIVENWKLIFMLKYMRKVEPYGSYHIEWKTVLIKYKMICVVLCCFVILYIYISNSCFLFFLFFANGFIHVICVAKALALVKLVFKNCTHAILEILLVHKGKIEIGLVKRRDSLDSQFSLAFQREQSLFRERKREWEWECSKWKANNIIKYGNIH